MQRFSHSLAGASALAFVLTIGSAQAVTSTDHTWVSSTGTGTACTRAAPCADFATAYAATNAGGVISVLDSGDYGLLVITKSLSVQAETVDGGTVFVTGGPVSITVNVAASDVVSIEGLHLTDADGISMDGAGSLFIRNCLIRNGHGVGSPSPTFPGYGIRIDPNSLSKVVISDTTVENNGSSFGGAGVWITPRTGGSAQVTLNRVIAEGNQFGIAVDGSNSTAGINVTITDSVAASNNQDGIVATTSAGGAPIGVMVKNSKSTNNAIGIRSIGPNVTVRVDGSTITGNGTGLAFVAGGELWSYRNNSVDANGTDGAFSDIILLK